MHSRRASAKGRFVAMGGQPSVRAGVLTDNGHPLVDVRGLSISDPDALERGADLQATTRGPEAETPLAAALRGGQEAAAAALRRHGAR